MPVPAHPVLDQLDEALEAGHLLIPLVTAEDPLGIPPTGMAHFSRAKEQIRPEDRPPIHAVDNAFRAAFMSSVYYRSYHVGLPYNAAITLCREGEEGEIVGYQCYGSEALKRVLGRISNVSTFVSVVERESNDFRAKEPQGQGNSYYADRQPHELKEVTRLPLTLDVLGPELIETMEDPIVDEQIRSYYKQMGVRGAEIAAYEQSTLH
jgi:hypothetical protein